MNTWRSVSLAPFILTSEVSRSGHLNAITGPPPSTHSVAVCLDQTPGRTLRTSPARNRCPYFGHPPRRLQDRPSCPAPTVILYFDSSYLFVRWMCNLTEFISDRIPLSSTVLSLLFYLMGNSLFVQAVPFILSLNMAALTGCSGGYKVSMR